MSTGEHDQYLVRVTGSGRLTLRNRQFLRRFQIPTDSLNRIGNTTDRWADSQSNNKDPISSTDVGSQPSPKVPSSPMLPQMSRGEDTHTTEDSSNQPDPITLPCLPVVQQCQSPDDTSSTEGLQTSTQGTPAPLRRSTRRRKQTSFYDAHSGK